MSDIDDLTQFTLTGLESAVVAGEAGDLGAVGVRVSVTVTARPEVVHVPSDPPRAHRIRPVKFRIEDGVLVLPGGGVGAVRLVANVGLGITGHLLYDVKFGAGSVGGDGVDFGDQNFTFAAPTSDTSVDLFTVERLAGKTPSGTILRMVPDHFRLDDDGNMIVSSNGIDISGPMPVVVSAAADWDMLINIPPVVAVGDTQAAARSAIGAGTSSLALGTSSSTAKAGDYQPTSENISDATETGRSVVTAANAAAARSAIGAAAGNDSRLTDTRTPTDGTVTTAKIVDANVTKAKLSAGVQTSLDKADTAYQAPAVVGAGATQSDARTAIGVPAATDVIIELPAGTGVTVTDTTLIQNALTAVVEGGTVRLKRGSTYAVSAVSLSGKSVTFDGNNATIVASANSTAFTYTGGWEWTRAVSAISEQTWNSIQTTRLTVSAVTSLAAGDVLRLVADDVLPGSRPNPTTPTELCRTGEYVTVGEVDAVNGYVYLTNIVHESYATNIRLSKLKRSQLKVRDLVLDITDAGYAANYNPSMIQVNAAWQPILTNVQLKRGYGTGIVFRGCYNYRADNLRVDWLPNEQTVYRLGYGICDTSSEYGVVTAMSAGTCRHAYTSATEVVATDSDPMYYGRTAHARIVAGTAIGSSNSGWDVHSDAYDVTFTDCVSYAPYQGISAVGAGFTLRGRDVAMVRCRAFNCRYGFYITDQYDHSAIGITLDHCEAINSTVSGVTLDAGTDLHVRDVTIIGGRYEGRTNGLFSTRADIKLVGRPVFRILPSPTPIASAYAVRATTESALTGDSLDVDLSQSNATANVAVRVEGSSTAHVNNGEVFSGSNDITQVFWGATTPGNVEALGWVLDKAPATLPGYTGLTDLIRFKWRVKGSATAGTSAPQSTATAAGTTTLDSSSSLTQIFTGSTTQTVKLPTTGVLAGTSYTIINNSSGNVTVQSSNASAILVMPGARVGVFMAGVDTPTTAADWQILTATGTTGTGGSPTTGAVLIRDTNGNAWADNFAALSTATATAAGITTLDINSRQVQVFTGSTTQTVKLPTSSVTVGQTYRLVNQSSGVVSVQSSGANAIDTVAAGAAKDFVALQSAPTAAAHWAKQAWA